MRSIVGRVELAAERVVWDALLPRDEEEDDQA
jgi:hypothetical protein